MLHERVDTLGCQVSLCDGTPAGYRAASMQAILNLTQCTIVGAMTERWKQYKNITFSYHFSNIQATDVNWHPNPTPSLKKKIF